MILSYVFLNLVAMSLFKRDYLVTVLDDSGNTIDFVKSNTLAGILNWIQSIFFKRYNSHHFTSLTFKITRNEY